MSVNKLFFSAVTVAFFFFNYTRLLPVFIKKKKFNSFNDGSHLDVKSKGYVAIAIQWCVPHYSRCHLI